VAITQLPTIGVNDAQLAALLEVFGSAQGYTDWLVQQLLHAVKQHKQQQIQVIYKQRLDDLNAQEAKAMADVDTMLANLVAP
jgi:hypothetical protein